MTSLVTSCMMDGLGTPSRLVAAANFDGWTVTALSIGAGERRHLLVENDALGDYEYEVSYACGFEGDETTGCCSRSAPQLRRLAAALVQDVPGAIVPPLGLAAAAGCGRAAGAFGSALARHAELRRSKALVAFLLDAGSFVAICDALLGYGDDADGAFLGTRLAMHEGRIRAPDSENGQVIADILAWRKDQEKLLRGARAAAAAALDADAKRASALAAAVASPFFGKDLVSPEALAKIARPPPPPRPGAALTGMAAVVARLDDALGYLRSVAVASLAVERVRGRALAARKAASKDRASHATRSRRLNSAARRVAAVEDDTEDDGPRSSSATFVEYALRFTSSVEVAAASFESDDAALRESSEAARGLEEVADGARLRFTREVAGHLDDFNRTRAEIFAALLRDEADAREHEGAKFRAVLAELPFEPPPQPLPTADSLDDVPPLLDAADYAADVAKPPGDDFPVVDLVPRDDDTASE